VEILVLLVWLPRAVVGYDYSNLLQVQTTTGQQY